MGYTYRGARAAAACGEMGGKTSRETRVNESKKRPEARRTWGWVEVYVEPHDALPDGASMRFKANTAPRAVRHVRYESDDGDDGLWQVLAPTTTGIPQAAMACLTDDSGAGESMLIYGGDLGLRLRLGDLEVAETYLLLAPDDV